MTLPMKIKPGLLRLWVAASTIWLIGVAYDGICPWLPGAVLGWSHVQLWARLRDEIGRILPPVLAGKTGVYFAQPDGQWALPDCGLVGCGHTPNWHSLFRWVSWLWAWSSALRPNGFARVSDRGVNERTNTHVDGAFIEFSVCPKPILFDRSFALVS